MKRIRLRKDRVIAVTLVLYLIVGLINGIVESNANPELHERVVREGFILNWE